MCVWDFVWVCACMYVIFWARGGGGTPGGGDYD